MRALRQTHAARAARSSAAGGAAAVDSDRWINIGPAPILDKRPVSGRVAAIAVDPRDLQHWLIGAAQGGIWETRDAGTTWTPKTDDAASLAMGAIAFAPGDPDVIYAGHRRGRSAATRMVERAFSSPLMPARRGNCSPPRPSPGPHSAPCRSIRTMRALWWRRPGIGGSGAGRLIELPLAPPRWNLQVRGRRNDLVATD